MTPTIGRIVTAVGLLARSNGTDECPAMITRVWSQREDGAWLVNATLFRDAASENYATSVYLFFDGEAARTVLAENEHATALHWPARV